MKMNKACLDIDECQDPEICGDNAVCINFNGWYDCKCIPGYEINLDDEECIDINECANGENKCSDNADCNNTPCSYTCKCFHRYFGNGFRCAYQNKCSHDNDCDFNAVCKNFLSGNVCECNDGYEGDGFTCNDINEASRLWFEFNL